MFHGTPSVSWPLCWGRGHFLQDIVFSLLMQNGVIGGEGCSMHAQGDVMIRENDAPLCSGMWLHHPGDPRTLSLLAEEAMEMAGLVTNQGQGMLGSCLEISERKGQSN